MRIHKKLHTNKRERFFTTEATLFDSEKFCLEISMINSPKNSVFFLQRWNRITQILVNTSHVDSCEIQRFMKILLTTGTTCLLLSSKKQNLRI